jgi:tRNA pseudouridine38-40 synthase
MEYQRYLIKFYYIGSEKYSGSQRQPNHITIEDRIIECLLEKGYIYDMKSAGFEVASRTDKFVSAKGACFSFLSLKEPILMEINSILPADIGLWAYCRVGNDFSSRFNAIFRYYKYILPISINEADSPKYNFDLLNKVCKIIEGRHNFQNFSKREKEDTNLIRDILLATFRVEDEFIIFDFKSQSFLRQQIRRIVAKIMEVARGILPIDEFIKLFEMREYISYQPADPRGLILWEIGYDREIQFNNDPKSIERMERFLYRNFYKFNLKQKLFRLLQHSNIS